MRKDQVFPKRFNDTTLPLDSVWKLADVLGCLAYSANFGLTSPYKPTNPLLKINLFPSQNTHCISIFACIGTDMCTCRYGYRCK
jgi:hypothetical protein